MAAVFVAVGSWFVPLVRARADDPTRVLVVGRDDDALVLAIVDELAAVGIDSEIVSVPDSGQDWRSLRRLARLRASALLISASRTEDEIDVVLVDRISGKVTVRSLAADGTDPSAVRRIALRTVDLLRVSLRELERGTPVDAEVPVPEFAERIGVPAPEAWVGVGAGVGGSVGGLGPWGTLQVWTRVESYAPLTLALRASIPVLAATLESEIGVADVRPWELALDVRLRARVGPLALEGGMAASFWLVSMHGRAAAPYIGRDDAVPALLGSVVVGASLDLARGFRLRLDGGLGLSLPEVAVRLGDARRATLGVPAVWSLIGVEVSP
jgi:hypothetical protein